MVSEPLERALLSFNDANIGYQTRICKLSGLSLSSCKYRTSHIICTWSNEHEVKQNEVFNRRRRVSSVASVTISFIEFVFTKDQSLNCSVVRLN
jgi:hypothetical protein